MQVDASVDEADVGGIREGQAVEFGVDAYPGTGLPRRGAPGAREFAGLCRTSSPMTRCCPRPMRIRPCCPGSPPISASSPPIASRALLVPNAALRWRPVGSGAAPAAPGTGTAYVLGAGDRPQPVTLRLGISDGNLTEVTEGSLQPGQRLVVGSSRPPARRSRARPAWGRRGSDHGGLADRHRAPVQGLSARAADPARAERRFGAHRAGRVRGGDGPVGLGQVDLHEHARLPRQPDPRHLPARPASDVSAWPATSWRASATSRSASSSRASTCCRARPRSRTSSCRCSTQGVPRRRAAAPGRGAARRGGPGDRPRSPARRSSRAASSSAWPSPARWSTTRC